MWVDVIASIHKLGWTVTRKGFRDGSAFVELEDPAGVTHRITSDGGDLNNKIAKYVRFHRADSTSGSRPKNLRVPSSLDDALLQFANDHATTWSATMVRAAVELLEREGYWPLPKK